MSEKTDFIQEYITRCMNVTSNGEAEKLIEEIVSVFGKEIDGLTDGLDTHNQLHFWEEMNGGHVIYDYMGDINLLKQKLTAFKISCNTITAKGPGQVINVNTNVAVTITLEQALSNVDKTQLPEKEKEYIKEQLAIISTKKGNKEKVWEAAKSFLKWLGDKSVEAGIAALPYINSLIGPQ